MTCEIRPGFLRDVERLGDRRVQAAVHASIEQVQAATTLADVTQIKKLKGHGNFFRLRVGHYRLGVEVDRQTVTFIRCLHRREIYRRFP